MLGFINLAELAAGKSAASDGYEALLAAARRARNERRAIFPPSSTHVIELCDIGDVQRQRERVAVIDLVDTWRAALY
jgi:hypothetical protein